MDSNDDVELGRPRIPWVTLLIAAIVFVLALFVLDHPNSQLAHLLRPHG